MKYTPGEEGFPYSIDLVGGKMKTLAFNVVGLGGHVLTIVEEDDPSFPTPLYPSQNPRCLFMVNATLSTVFIGAAGIVGKRPEDWETYREGLKALAKLFDDGSITAPKVTNVGPLTAENVRKAHEQLEDGHTKGKLVVSIV